MADRRGLAILLWAAGPDAPERCATPFFHAAAAAAMDAEVEVHFSGPAVRLLLPGVAEALRPAGKDGESLAHFMRMARANGARFLVCHAAWQAFAGGAAIDNEAVDGIAGAASFAQRALDPDWATLVY